MSEGVIASVLKWLRAGYPDGVPPKDYFPLLALLRRTLTTEEVDEVVAELAQDDQDKDEAEKVRLRDIRAAIQGVTDDEANEDDVRRIAARLAAVGWPLSGGARKAAAAHEDQQHGVTPPPAPEPATPQAAASDDAAASAESAAVDPSGEDGAGDLERRNLITQVLAWLREGYPEGVPTRDYIPLLALLRRRLTDDEAREVADRLLAEAPEGADVSELDAQVLMTKVLGELPSDSDIARVRERLEAAGANLV